MEDFTFGTLATDDLKLIHHRAARRGIYHGHELDPCDPRPAQPVTLSVRIGAEVTADHVACYYTLDGSEPAGAHATPSNGQVVNLDRVDVVWDSLVWSYLTIWQGVLPGQPEGTVVRYRIGAWTDGEPEVFADWPEAQAIAEEAAGAFFRGEPLPDAALGDPARVHTFTFWVDRLGPPSWAREAVIYHVFVDRFFRGRDRDWLQTHDLRSFCGGTLWGLVEKLDYVAKLGSNCLWLSPVFPSPSHHGYDATDLFHVEPRLGGDEALRTLVAEAHSRGIRVLLDFVCNHISDQHPVFVDARSNTSSPYRDWFTFDDSVVGYRTFFSVPSMPQINVANRDARRWLIDAARHWLGEYDVDGYRLDYASGPGPDFWADFWTACKGEKPDSFCFGEVIDAPDALRTYVGRLDGCLDFFVGHALRHTYALNKWAEDELERFLNRHQAFFPADFLMPTFLDNHDMDRFLFLANGDKDALRRAAATQMRLPGPPIIYYGTEVGLTQNEGTNDGLGLDAARIPMIWGEQQDEELFAYFQDLIRMRRESGFSIHPVGA